MKQSDKTPRIFGMSFASVYKLYIVKVEKKGRTKASTLLQFGRILLRFCESVLLPVFVIDVDIFILIIR